MRGEWHHANGDAPSGDTRAAGSLLFVRSATAEQEASEELRYLHELNLAEAAGVFDSVESLPADRLGEALPHFDLTLLQGSEAILLGRASLGAMRARLHDPDPAARATATYPERLDRVLGDRVGPLFTLRQYEGVEARWLARETDDATSESGTGQRPRDVPAVLVRSRDLRSRCDATSLAVLPGDETRLGELAVQLGARPAGLCHCFIDYYGTVREDVLELLPEGAVDVLEVGCGRGGTGELLQRERGCRVTGVEVNPVVARQAQERLHRVIEGDATTVELGGPYDAAVLFEVVEHVGRPDELLRRVASRVRPGGTLLLSVPNVGHHAVVEDLIAGRWDYLPVGLLCTTHLRFFTRRTLERLLVRCGFDSYRVLEQRTELPPRIRSLTAGLDADLDSLATHGFHVVVAVGAGDPGN